MNPMVQRFDKSSSRLTGAGAVVIIHAALIAALCTGLVHQTVKKDPGPTQLQVLKAPDPTPPPLPLLRPQLEPQHIALSLVPPVEPVVETASPRDAITAQPMDRQPVARDGSGPSHAQPPVAEPSRVSNETPSAGAVCTRMDAPVIPAVSWSGEALFHVVASTQAGRVVAVDIQTVRGHLDARSQRQIRSAIDSALREGYVCPGEVHFSQDFQVRVD